MKFPTLADWCSPALRIYGFPLEIAAHVELVEVLMEAHVSWWAWLAGVTPYGV